MFEASLIYNRRRTMYSKDSLPGASAEKPPLRAAVDPSKKAIEDRKRPVMATIRDDDERMLARIGYKQVRPS